MRPPTTSPYKLGSITKLLRRWSEL